MIQKKAIFYSTPTEDGFASDEKIKYCFQQQRNLAKEELENRGNPPLISQMHISARALVSMTRIQQEGLLEAINITLSKTNYTEIPGIFELADSIGVPKVTIIGLKPCQDYLEELLSPQEYQEAINLACQAAQETGIEFFFDEPFFWATVREWELSVQVPVESTGILYPSTTACIFGEYLFIEPGGEVKPCSFSPMVVGDVKANTLGEIWHELLSSPFIHQLNDLGTRSGYCRSCQYLEDCKGCRSRTAVLTGDWFASDPCCPLSLKLAIKEED